MLQAIGFSLDVNEVPFSAIYICIIPFGLGMVYVHVCSFLVY
jgi:hypothetical protein